jgi:hypothetical protein
LCPVGAEVVTLAHEPLVDGHVGRVRHVLPDPPGVPPAERAALPLRNGLVTLKKRSSDVTTRVSTFERDLSPARETNFCSGTCEALLTLARLCRE